MTIPVYIPPALKGSYKLSEDSIKAMQELVQIEFRKCLEKLSIDEEIMNRYQKQLDTYMMKQYPDLSNRLNSLSLVLDDQVKNLEKRLSQIEKREKVLVKSESLYQDVYAIKDRVKVLDDFICTFKSKMKKAFDL